MNISPIFILSLPKIPKLLPNNSVSNMTKPEADSIPSHPRRELLTNFKVRTWSDMILTNKLHRWLHVFVNHSLIMVSIQHSGSLTLKDGSIIHSYSSLVHNQTHFCKKAAQTCNAVNSFNQWREILRKTLDIQLRRKQRTISGGLDYFLVTSCSTGWLAIRHLQSTIYDPDKGLMGRCALLAFSNRIRLRAGQQWAQSAENVITKPAKPDLLGELLLILHIT